MRFLFIIIVLFVFLLFIKKDKITIKNDYTPYAVNYQEDNHMGIHDDYRWSPDTKMKTNSFVDYNNDFAAIYKRYPCMNCVPCTQRNLVGAKCASEYMIKTGSVQKSFEACSYPAPISGYCPYNT
jgi:hypothetical protein